KRSGSILLASCASHESSSRGVDTEGAPVAASMPAARAELDSAAVAQPSSTMRPSTQSRRFRRASWSLRGDMRFGSWIIAEIDAHAVRAVPLERFAEHLGLEPDAAFRQRSRAIVGLHPGDVAALAQREAD